MKKWSEIRQGIVDKLFMDAEEVTGENNQYAAKFAYFANECLNQIANGIKPRIATLEITTTEENTKHNLPEDFLSFTDMINYLDDQPDPTIIYYGGNLILPKKGHYVIFYNATWQPITEENMDDSDLPIDASVLNCVPTYVAAQILAEDDVQRSTILKNEYELMLSRLDTNVMYESNSFKSTGGWY